MTFNIIMWASIIWLPVLMYFILKNETKPKKNIVVGVTLPYEGRSDAQVLARLEKFKKQLFWTNAAVIALAIPCVFIRDADLMMSLWCAWIIPAVAAPYVPYVCCNRDLRGIKRSRGWEMQRRDEVTVDLSAIPVYKPLPDWIFALPFALCLLPLVWDRSFWVTYFVNALCVLLYVACRHLHRAKSERVDDNSALALALSRVRRKNWERIWIFASAFSVLLSFGCFLTRNSPTAMLAVLLLLCFGMCACAAWGEFSLRKTQEKLTADSGVGNYVDEDDKWIWGLFYYNPRDSRTMVNDRVGMNTTVNLARPGGKVCAVLVAALLLFMPFIGPLTVAAVDKPIELSLDEAVLSAASGSTEYAIELESITGAELLETLPEGLSRRMGTSIENLLKGRFYSPETGDVFLCLDPGEGPFLLVTTETGRSYLFGSREEGAAEAIYERLK